VAFSPKEYNYTIIQYELIFRTFACQPIGGKSGHWVGVAPNSETFLVFYG